MSTELYYAFEGTAKGPFTRFEFDDLIANGTVRRDTLVWQEGMDDWMPLGRTDVGADTGLQPPRAPFATGEDPARADANSFVGALKDGFARYVDFQTRSTRSQFWWWTLWSILFSIAATAVDGTLGMVESGPVGLLVSLGMFLPSLAVAIRRLHDTGRTGWWYLIILVPLVGWIVLIVFFCTRSEPAANQWGPAPAG